jgi:hydrogenase maturation protein HypF
VTLALARGREVFLSQHLGDMESFEGRQVYRRTLEDFLRLYRFEPELVACDLHPDYFTTQLARELGWRTIAVQHHHAHLAACMAENGLEGEVLGVTWDGTGYGPDGTVWGGEMLLGDASRFERVATLHPFRLAGGDRAIKEPWRVALALLLEAFGEELPQDLPLFRSFPESRTRLVLEMLRKGLNSPVTTSVGRLFDGVSALLGISYENAHQAQAAQLLEYAAWRGGVDVPPFPLEITGNGCLRFDWREMVRGLVEGLRAGVPVELLAARFHRTLVGFILEISRRVGLPRVLLCGGVFANRWLTEAALGCLEGAGLQGYIHTQLPPTDGSLSLGQLWVAANRT